jgi:23S rRNA pseudouridine2605 synthase
MSESDITRLNKYIALHQGISRRQADELIERGKVTINSQTAVIGARLQPGDKVTINGKLVDDSTEFVYLMLNKPVGYVCSRRKQGESPTIYDLLPQKYKTLKTVGRLDRDSSGLILLTNDGDFALQMTHPRYHKVKRYEVSLDKPLEPLHQQMISDFGVDLEDGKSKLLLERQSDDRKDWTVTMSEGRNRQIRRTFAALGYTVAQLHRTHFGPYTLHDLPSSSYLATTKK